MEYSDLSYTNEYLMKNASCDIKISRLGLFFFFLKNKKQILNKDVHKINNLQIQSRVDFVLAVQCQYALSKSFPS